MDGHDKENGRRYSDWWAIPMINSIIHYADVQCWEDLKGKDTIGCPFVRRLWTLTGYRGMR